MKLFKNRILFICLVVSFQMEAQNNWQKNTGKSFESKVAYSKKPFELNVNNESLKIEFTRFIEIKDFNEFNLKIKRIRQKSKTSMTSMDIDTDKPFPNNDIEKGALENYLQYVNKPIKLIITQKNKGDNVNNLWLAKLPMINSIQQLSGIFIENYSKNEWTDTLETDGQIYINKYILEGDSTILLEGTSGLKQLKKKEINNYSDSSNPNSGESIEAKSDGKRLIYKAKIYFNKANNFILKVDGTINTIETMTVMGEKHDRNINDFFQVINKEL